MIRYDVLYGLREFPTGFYDFITPTRVRPSSFWARESVILKCELIFCIAWNFYYFILSHAILYTPVLYSLSIKMRRVRNTHTHTHTRQFLSTKILLRNQTNGLILLFFQTFFIFFFITMCIIHVLRINRPSRNDV